MSATYHSGAETTQMLSKNDFYSILEKACITENRDKICFDVLEIFKINDIDDRTNELDNYLFEAISPYRESHGSIRNMMFAHKQLLNDFLEINILISGGKIEPQKQINKPIEKIALQVPREKAIENLCKASTITFNHKIIIELLKANDRPMLEDYLESTFKQHNKKQFFNNDDFFKVWECGQ